MAEFNPRKYEPTIDAILRTVNLEEITAKRLRRGLEGIFGVDLSNFKKEVDNVIMDRYLYVQEELENPKTAPKTIRRQEEEDAMLAAQLQSNWNRRQLRDAGEKVKKKRKATDTTDGNAPKRRGTGGGFQKPLLLSPQLQEVLAERTLSRPQVVKRLWAYIKEHNLQDPDDKRMILCDEKLRPILGTRVSSFAMNKYLKDHLFTSDEVLDDAANGNETTNGAGEID